MSETLQLVFLDPKTISDSDIDGVVETTTKAFTAFNASVGATAEVVQDDFGDPTIAPMIIKGICKSLDGFAVTNDDGNIVAVSFVDVHAKGSRVAVLGPVASVARSGGKKTFVAACAHAEKLGFSTLALMQVASNSRSFSLYASVGFEAKHTCQYMGGFLPSSEPLPQEDTGDLTLAAMSKEDIQECADLFLAAHGADSGWNRQPDIIASLGSGAPFATLVARDASGKVVGYSTGFYIAGHQVAVSQDVFCTMLKESSRLHQRDGLPFPRFHCPTEFPQLLSWALAQRLTVLRATVIMAKGSYDHAWPHNGFVVAPSISGW